MLTSNVGVLSCARLFSVLWPTKLLCHRVSQARILEWVAISLSRTSSQPKDQTQSPALQADSALQAVYIRSCCCCCCCFPSIVVRIHHCLFICPTTDEHLWCFHLGTITNKDMMNIFILSFYSFLLGIYLQVESLDH